MSGWRETTLGELLDVKHGFAFLGQYFGDTGSHIVLTPGNFAERGGFRSKGSKEKWYSGPIPDEYVLRRGDLLVAMTEQAEGLLGSSAIVPADDLYLHNQRLGLIQIRDADPSFVYHLFNTPSVRQQIRATASGVKVRHTSPSRIAAVRVRVPDLAEQRRIAGILSAYDSLIENCERRVRLLDGMARALYNEWFVLLRYSGAATGDHFSHGRRRMGSSREALGSVITVHRGRSYRSNELATEGGLPFINLKCIDRDGGFRRTGIKRFVGSALESHRVQPGDVILAVTDMTQERRIVARAALVPSLDAEFGVLSMDLVRLEASSAVSRTWLYSYLRFSDFADHLKQHANGANVLHLSPDLIREHVTQIPSPELARDFGDVAGPLYEAQNALENRIENLNRTRDLLLPRLLSGELSVKAAVRAA